MASRRGLVQTLARAAEYRDNETAHHIMRVGRYVGIIARELGMPDEIVELLEEASLLHDVGKIGIPDAILLKPGETDGRRIRDHAATLRFRTADHSAVTRQCLGTLRDAQPTGSDRTGQRDRLVDPRCRHHRPDPPRTLGWRRLPLGLKGEQIPIEGRITAVADVFDALDFKTSLQRRLTPASSASRFWSVDAAPTSTRPSWTPFCVAPMMSCRSKSTWQIRIELGEKE